MYTQEQVESVKLLNMHDVARALGLRVGRNRLYYAPWRDEQTASLSVHQGNGVWLWRDYGGEDKDGGSNIDLVMRAQGCGFGEAMRYLHALGLQPRPQQVQGPGDIPARKPTGAGDGKRRIVRVQENQTIRESLILYAASRGIGELPGWVRDIEYTIVDGAARRRTFYGLGVQNLSGGWDIRSPLGKFKIGKNDTSLVRHGEDNRSVYIVEGVFDALSLHMLMGPGEYDTLILNSVVNRGKAIEVLMSYKQIVIVPDHDDQGKKTSDYIEQHETLRDVNVSIYHYPGEFKDANDYWQSVRKQALRNDI